MHSTKGCSAGSCLQIPLHPSGCEWLYCNFRNPLFLLGCSDPSLAWVCGDRGWWIFLHSATSLSAELINPPSAFTTRVCWRKQVSAALVKQPWSRSFCEWGNWPCCCCDAVWPRVAPASRGWICQQAGQGWGLMSFYFSKLGLPSAFKLQSTFHPKLCSLLVFPVWLTIYFLLIQMSV